MNSCDKSLEDGPSVVTKVFPCIFLVISGHFNWFYGGRGLGSVGGLQGSFKKDLHLNDYSVISRLFFVSWRGGSNI